MRVYDPHGGSAEERGCVRANDPHGGSAEERGCVRVNDSRISSETWPPAALVDSIERSIGPHRSRVALVLGSGLGGIAESMEALWVGDGHGMPGYPVSTVAGHEGRLLFGRLRAEPSADRSESRRPYTWVVQGRVHLYEGHTPEPVTRYVRLLYALGVRALVLTNAAGSVDTRVQPGDLVLADDAISMFLRPLARSSRDAPLGTLWQSRSALSDPGLIRLAEETAAALGIPLQRGVLVGSMGPAYETAAEVRVWRRLGGTVASMSTVPEAVQARELGMRVILLSLVTNLGTGLSTQRLTHQDVVETADRAGATLGRLLTELTTRLGELEERSESSTK